MQRLNWDPIQAEKGGYKHFMLKEIHEQTQAVQDTFAGRVDFENSRDPLRHHPDEPRTSCAASSACTSSPAAPPGTRA